MYTQFFGFSEKPFETLPDPKFFYTTSDCREALASMMDGTRNPTGFISIVGEAGTGKTALVHFFLQGLTEKVKTALIFHPSLLFNDLLRNILLELGQKVQVGSRKELLDLFSDYLRQKVAIDETVLVIIDDAQKLPRVAMKELLELPKLASQASRRFQIIFVGQPELEKELHSAGVRELNRKIQMRLRIRPLNQEESTGYVEHRLRLVGSTTSQMFTEQAISMVFNYAQGIPRLMNILCDNAFFIGHRFSKKKIDTDIIREVIRNLEGPSSQKKIPAFLIAITQKANRLSSMADLVENRILLIIAALIFLGGITYLFTYESLKKRPATQSLQVEKAEKNSKASSAPVMPPATQSLRVEKAEGLESHQPVSHQAKKDESANEIVLSEGDTISHLAMRHYGMANQSVMDLILEFNPKIANVHLILVNERIMIPKLRDESLIRQYEDGSYKIHLGTFWDRSETSLYGLQPELKGKEIEIVIRQVSPQDTWYRVAVGKFENKDEALKTINILKRKGLLPLFGSAVKTQ